MKKAKAAFKAQLSTIQDAMVKQYYTDTNHGTKAKEQGDWATKYTTFIDAIAKKKWLV